MQEADAGQRVKREPRRSVAEYAVTDERCWPASATKMESRHAMLQTAPRLAKP